MAKWLDATITKRIDWNAHLFSLQFTCDEFTSFKAGQFVKVGLEQSIEGEIETAKGNAKGIAKDNVKILSRPYSLVNAPSEGYLEIMAVPVENGNLSPQLHTLKEGDTLKVMSPATGFLIIEEVPASEHLFMLATGTGVGPFLSILHDTEVWNKYKKVVLVYAVRKAEDLAYLSAIRKIEERYPKQFTLVPVISREHDAQALFGRIPALIESKALQQHCGIQITPETSQVMICGNPDMITDSLNVLAELGLVKHLRRSPGHISMERYW